MDLNFVSYLCASLICFIYISYVNGQDKIFPVTKYGAIADGNTDINKPLLGAWRDACEADGGLILVPKGNFLLSGATLNGPCNGATVFQNEGIITASPGAHGEEYWISFYEVNGLTIRGGGTFDGNGPSAWSLQKTRPTSIKISKCNNLTIRDIVSLNSKEFHFHIIVSDNILINNVYIRAPADSPNTDGIHLGRCTNVNIINSRISTGDDCISMGDGSKNINIESVICGPGHGISIGSLGRYVNEEDVTGVTVRNCSLINTANGLRIKTLAPSTVSTTVSNVTFEDINLRNVRNPIVIDQYYCMKSSCSHAKDSSIKINGVKYINVKGTTASPIAVNLQCSRAQPCEDLEFEGMELLTGEGKPGEAVCSSAHFEYNRANNVPSKCVTPHGDWMVAFLGAWRDACASYGGVIEVPKRTFVVSGASFNGPCNGPTFFMNKGVILASPGAHYKDFWISFYEVNGLTIRGGGTFDGNGPTAWRFHKSRPTSIYIAKCNNLNIRDIVSLNSKMFHFHIVVSDNVVVNNVNIMAPADSPNTDGIHLARCANVSITNSRIATGDDCISMGDGSKNINIEYVMCGPGHGISIGSLGRYVDEEDVTGVAVKNCTLINTTNGLRIKTWAPSTVSTTVSDIVFQDVKLRNVQNPIIIDQYYCQQGSCSHARESSIKINGVKYINVKGTSASPVGVNLQCSKSRPCQNLEFQGVRLTLGGGKSTGAICSSAHFQYIDPSNVPSKCVSPQVYDGMID
ncbi:pectin lyase-like superfamily protein [Striga asiatica]|uniref:Pectin lyase-like superfamily protein n=1 Tax=Striga asiatica TaxID=4170 RepID=A0A5A7QAG6_STRAF|nr:pectin lyase-like superfamily protein [Striga asiatica]